MKEYKETKYEFVDTNILVYAYDESAGQKHITAKRILENLWKKGNGALSTQVFQEFFVVVTKKVKNPLDYNTAAQIISDLSFWKVYTIEVSDILEAIKISQRYKISFWDSLIICSAKNLGCSILWSEDLNSGQYFGKLKVLNPFLQS
ncbi:MULTISPECIES: PIN domain-containing protein [Fervidobacterium]|uniref:PilT protein domain protein n=1 Tax=Fervidobacterium nodosum (strain ATCC 35602 / DSM 5306 / Rt17-B1) TaxID=381764 RepID=A7HNT3_FERNB|nr:MULTISPECIES: PIN domain-containing protein [Fervidobacterium]ABS61566.1 PilT protein domain protein [Fervidobacterium nodosum Rt17-B1]KAF2961891.1 twitching motility protein PilT [Fervidobacterium sp. 2310opik-2]HOJ93879.1 PIN domain-containing protein [Fervidobacterium nodosum]